MNYEEQYFKQILVSMNKSYKGFGLLVSLVTIAGVGIYFLLKHIVKGVRKMLLEREEQNLQREVHRRAVTRFLRLLESTNYTLNWNIIKSHTNRSTYDLTQHINFVAFNEQERRLEIINMLVNEVLYDTLTISTSKDRDLAGTIVAKNGDIYKIQEDLENVTGVHINFRNY